MAAEGVLKKPLYKRVILTQIPAEYATFAEYCLTSVCHPVLTGAQLLEGHKRYKYIPIETIYFIGAMILLMVVTSERDCVTLWEYYTTLGQPMGSETQHMSTDLIASGLDASMDELISLTNFTCLTEIRNLFQKGALLYDMRMLKQQIYLAECDEQKRHVMPRIWQIQRHIMNKIALVKISH
uniref:Uncharacterized protein n=1 Tax=Panagrolaimus sp. PS1159 TaxID=55785 RepID=A0AC35F4F1_9BILA